MPESWKQSLRWISIFAAMVPLAARAAQVLTVGPNDEYVITTKDSARRWITNDSVCLYEESREVACGVVAQTTNDKIGIKLSTVQGKMKRGAYIDLRQDKRRPASAAAPGTSETMMSAKKTSIVDASFGVLAGFNYFFPAAHVQVALTDSFSIGIMPAYFDSRDTASRVEGLGGFLTVNYYYTHFPFRGFFIQSGLGMYSMTVETNTVLEKVSPLAIPLSLQWRGKAYWGLPLDIGVGAGLQYLFPTNGTVAVGFSGLLPLFTAYLGYSF